MQNPLMTEKDVRELLGVSRTTLWRMRLEGIFPVKPLAVTRRNMKFKRADVELWAATPSPAPNPDTVKAPIKQVKRRGRF